MLFVGSTMKFKSPTASFLGLLLMVSLPFFMHPNTGAAAAPTKPNIVFILTDDQAMNQLKNMPFLSSKPNGSWVQFDNAFVNVPFCCPTRSTILTGQYAHHHGINGSNGAPLNDASTIATWLKSSGYRTGLVGKYLNGYPFPSRPANYIPPGWDYWAAFTRVDHYNYTLNVNGATISHGSAPQDYSTDVLYQRALQFIDGTASNQPFMLYFSTHAPHAPNTPAPRHQGYYQNLPISFSPNFNEADVSDKPAWVRALPLRPRAAMTTLQRRAAETLLAVDEAIRGIVNRLMQRGQLDNTVIVFMTDNGFSFGSHRWIQKRCVYEECVRTPLLIRYPGLGTNRSENRLISSVDIAPTLAALAQATPSNSVDGASLVPLLTGASTGWRTSLLLQYQGPYATGESPTFWAVRTARWKYVELKTGEKELYDIVNDPYELVNVAGNPANAPVMSSLAAELARLRSG
jgi:N-acetylglucosamine-6-sulfatase